MVINLGQDPGYELGHVGVHSGQFGVGTADTPRNDTSDEPAVLFVRIWTQQRTTGITLCASGWKPYTESYNPLFPTHTNFHTHTYTRTH